MVRAIRYWGRAFDVLHDAENLVGRGSLEQHLLTGATLLGANGWDPYLEDPAT